MEGPLGNFFLRLGPASIPWQAPVKQDGSIAPSRPKQISRTSPSPELLKSFIRLLRNEMRDSRHLAATGSKRVVRFPIFWCVSHRLTSSHFKGQRTCHLKRATFGPQTRQRASYSMIEASKTPLAPQTGVSKLIGDSASIKRRPFGDRHGRTGRLVAAWCVDTRAFKDSMPMTSSTRRRVRVPTPKVEVGRNG